MELIYDLLGGYILSLVVFNIAMDIRTNKQMNIEKYLLVASLSFLIVSNYYLVSNELRVFLGLLDLMLVFKIMFDENLYSTFLLAIVIYILIILSELFFTFFALFILKIDQDFFINNMTGNLLSNILISLVLYLIYVLFKKHIIAIVDSSSIIKSYILILVLLVSIFVIGFYFFDAYLAHWELNYRVFLNFSAILLFCIIIFIILSERYKYHKRNNEYNNLVEYIKTNETILIENQKLQHEYFNNLIIIKNLKPKEIKNYIDNLLSNTGSTKNDMSYQLSYISNAMIKGMIFYKLCLIKKYNIDLGINISKQFKNITLGEKETENISKLMGIYFDNAIDSTKEKNNAKIILDIYLTEKHYIFELSNSFDNNVNIELLKTNGYSTKPSHKGLGLEIARDIISKSQNIEVNTLIENEYFVQKIKVTRNF